MLPRDIPCFCRALPDQLGREGDGMLAVRDRRGSSPPLLLLCTLMLLESGCSNKSTDPHPSIAGHVVIASGQAGDVSLSLVRLYATDPFVPGAAPVNVTTATGSVSDATFLFKEVPHGDYYVIAWKDEGDGVVGSGDLLGWYDGAVNGPGNPVAAKLHLIHGQNASITITVAPLPGPALLPATIVAGSR
jgi:hypothetical protein